MGTAVRRTGRAKLDDALWDAYARIEDQTVQPAGKPVGPVHGHYQAKLGDLVRCDTTAGDVRVRLADLSRDRGGDRITVSNEGHNRVLVYPPQGTTIDGWSEYPITKSVPPITFVALSDKRYMCAWRPALRRWWEWNGVDTTQFGTRVDGANAGTGVADLQYYASLAWIRVQADANPGGGDAATGSVWYPVADVAPPTANYRATCTALFRDYCGGSADYAGAIVWVRSTKQTDGYGALYSTTAAASDGCRILKFASGVASVLGTNVPEPQHAGNTDRGIVMSMDVEGDSILRTGHGAQQVATDAGSPITAVGNVALGTTTGGAAAGGTVTNWYRDFYVDLLD